METGLELKAKYMTYGAFQEVRKFAFPANIFVRKRSLPTPRNFAVVWDTSGLHNHVEGKKWVYLNVKRLES